MAKDKTVYRCVECEHRELRWMGRCPECGAWNSFETLAGENEPLPARGRTRSHRSDDEVRPVPIDAIPRQSVERFPVEPEELSRVLGGGIVPGSLILLGGAPGVGKSTLLTMVAGQMARAGRRVVYLAAEEAAAQVRSRAGRLDAVHPGFLLLEEPALEKVLPPLYAEPPALLVVDSIQTVLSLEMNGAPGSVAQIRACGSLLADFARLTGCAVLLIGHVTKEGELAGPRLLEHLVDTVLYFEPESDGQVRMVRAFKNRFGSTGELAVLEMGARGLSPVRDASALFLAGRRQGEAGSCVAAFLSGTRTFLVEIQALLVKSQYGIPTRVVTGMDSKRVAQLVAIVDRKTGVRLLKRDVYVKVAGGLRVSDPVADLAAVLAMVSSRRERPLPADLLALGEVGLTGELRPASALAGRLEEAQAHGFRRAVVACHDRGSLPHLRSMQLFPARTVGEALEAVFEATAPRQGQGEA